MTTGSDFGNLGSGNSGNKWDSNGNYCAHGGSFEQTMHVVDLRDDTIRTWDTSDIVHKSDSVHITEDGELFTRIHDHFLGGTPTALEIVDLDPLTVAQTIDLNAYETALQGAHHNNGFSADDIIMGDGSRRMLMRVFGVSTQHWWLCLTKANAGASWTVDWADQGVTSASPGDVVAYISLGPVYGYALATQQPGHVYRVTHASFVEDVISLPGIGSRELRMVSYFEPSDEVVVTCTNGNVLVYNSTLTTLLRERTDLPALLGRVGPGGDKRLDFGNGCIVLFLPTTDVNLEILRIYMLSVATLATVLDFDVDASDLVGKDTTCDFPYVNEDHGGIFIARHSQNCFFWPLLVPATATVEVELGLDVELASTLEICPTEGVGSDECIVGQTSLPLFICGKEQALERTCSLTATVTVQLGIEVEMPSEIEYLYIAFRQRISFEDLDTAVTHLFLPDPPLADYPFQAFPWTFDGYTGQIKFNYFTPNYLFIRGATTQGSYIYDAIAGTWDSADVDFVVNGIPEQLDGAVSDVIGPWLFAIEPEYIPTGGEFGIGAVSGSPDAENEIYQTYAFRWAEWDGTEISIPSPFDDTIFFKEGTIAIDCDSSWTVMPGDVGTHRFGYGFVTDTTWCWRVFATRATIVVPAYPPPDITIDWGGRTWTFWGTALREVTRGVDSRPIQMPGESWSTMRGDLYVLMRTPDIGNFANNIQLGIEIVIGALSGSAPPPPAGATFWLDFAGGNYYAGGSAKSVVDILGGPDFDAGFITPGTGMDTQYTNTNRPLAIGDLLTDAAALMEAGGISVVIEIDGSFGSADFLAFWSDTDTNAADKVEDIFSQSDLNIEDMDDVLTDVANPVGAGIHKIGGTWYFSLGGGNYQCAICADGATPDTQTVTYNGSINDVVMFSVGHAMDHDPYYWGATNENFVIRSITGYPAMSSSALQALTV